MASSEQETNHLIATVALKIRQSLNLSDILQSAVDGLRDLLKCDRVIIYSASQLKTGLVLAESVAPQFSSIMGETINDPFLEGKYREMYSYGMPVAIDDINISDKNKTELKDLEQVGVKSLMIAPIIIDNKLLALLAAHQCSQIELWHHESVIFLTEKANATGFALSQKPCLMDSSDGQTTMQLYPNENEQEVTAPQKIESIDRSSQLK